jgi:hypothetical protein
MKPPAPPTATTARSRKYSLWGFESGGEYAASLKRTPWLLLSRPWLRHDPRTETGHGKEGEDGEAEPALLRTLNWAHVSLLGVGLILGAGIFVSTGDAAANLAGCAVCFAACVLCCVAVGLGVVMDVWTFVPNYLFSPFASSSSPPRFPPQPTTH